MTRFTKKINIQRFEQGQLNELEDTVLVESPLSIFVNGDLISELTCTGDSIAQLVTGHLFCRGYISSVNDIYSMSIANNINATASNKSDAESDTVITSAKTSVSEAGAPVANSKTTDAITAIVNVADAESVRQKRTQGKQAKIPPIELDYPRILEVFKNFQYMSPLFKETGAVHSAGLLDLDFNFLCFFEDMGRHNAVDKVIGKALIDKLPLTNSILITSSRMPVEIVAKAGIAHIPVIFSISAPTLQSINYAKANDITLIGMFRNNRINIYNKV